MKKGFWIPVVGFVVCLSLAARPVRPGQATKATAVKLPHKILNIINVPYAKVEADLTSNEIIVTNTGREGYVILRLFRNYAPVPGPDYIYNHKDPARFPLQGLDLYVVSVSTEQDFAMATFQLVKEKLHILKQD